MTTEQLVDRISVLAKSGDWAGAHRLMVQLMTMMTESGRPLSSPLAFRLVEAMSVGTAMAAQGEANPYTLINQIKQIVSKPHLTPVERASLTAAWESLYALLASPTTTIETGAIHEVLVTLKTVRAFDLLARTADRALVRAPDDAVVRCLYGQALIDSGRIQAGLEMLASVRRLPNVSRREMDEAAGLIGRANKQVYVEHVTSPAVPPSLRAKYRPHLEGAIASYASAFNPERPADNYWHGINIVALLVLAREDGHADIKNPTNLAPEELARRMIAALEPWASSSTSDDWASPSLGQAYLAIGDYDGAMRWFREFAHRCGSAKHDPFKLQSAIRQLEEVWRIKPGQGRAGLVLAVLKAAQIAEPDAKFTLPAQDISRLQAFTSSPDYTLTESMVQGGNYVKLAALQTVVKRASGVTAICDTTGRTLGTGFLLKGRDLFEPWGDDLVVLTNAHVLSATAEPKSLKPNQAMIKLEAAEGSVLKFDPAILWESPVAQYDAAIVKVTSASDGLNPLPVATQDYTLKIEQEQPAQSGTGVSVIGHPLGGPLSLSIMGALSGANGVLVDAGGRTATGDPTYLHYRAPTEPGNSGSPVFETENWTVIGLHHMGFDQFSGRPRLGGKSGNHFANEGICIKSLKKAIASDLRPRGVMNRLRGS